MVANIKIYEAATLVSATEERAQQYKHLKEQLTNLKQAFQGIVDLDDAFQGKGADAIKAFYQGQMDVVEVWIQLIDVNISFLQGVAPATEEADLSGDTVVHIPFLEDELSHAYRTANEMVSAQQDDLQRIFSSIDDLVSLQVFSRYPFDKHIDQAEQERSNTVEKVNTLDQQLTDEYAISKHAQNEVVALFNQLLAATSQNGTYSPLNFDANAYHQSEAYQLKDDVDKQMEDYLTFKDKQAQARHVQEERENRAWYEKAWDTVSTFTGEVTGYFDYKRATEGVDPVTGEKLSNAERVAAGAMAAAGFIPVVGWIGRAAKGGKAIYKTTKAFNAADHALDAYKAPKSFEVLQKTEMGIYGLVTANGLGEAATGRDMFGNKLSEEERKQSLTQGLLGLGLGGAAHAMNRMHGTRLPYSNSYVNQKVNQAKNTMASMRHKAGQVQVPVGVRVEQLATPVGSVKHFSLDKKTLNEVHQKFSAKNVGGVSSGSNKGIEKAPEPIDNIIRDGSHFLNEFKLKPNVKYEVNGYLYETDDLGRIKKTRGKLTLEDGVRNTEHQLQAGEPDRINALGTKGDHGGHLIGTRFNGSPLIDNIVAMNGNVNVSSYKKIENTWAKALSQDKEVIVDIKPRYKGDSRRPYAFNITYFIDGDENKIKLLNKYGG